MAQAQVWLRSCQGLHNVQRHCCKTLPQTFPDKAASQEQIDRRLTKSNGRSRRLFPCPQAIKVLANRSPAHVNKFSLHDQARLDRFSVRHRLQRRCRFDEFFANACSWHDSRGYKPALRLGDGFEQHESDGVDAQGNPGTIIGGPVSADSLTFWQVSFNDDLTGWTYQADAKPRAVSRKRHRRRGPSRLARSYEHHRRRLVDAFMVVEQRAGLHRIGLPAAARVRIGPRLAERDHHVRQLIPAQTVWDLRPGQRP